MIDAQPQHFWDSNAFLMVMVMFVTAVTGLITAVVSWIAVKVKTIETHTNGMLHQLQQKVDDQNKLRETTEVVTQKNIEIAKLKTGDK